MIKINSIYGNDNTFLNFPDYGIKWATFTNAFPQKYINHSLGGARSQGILSSETPDVSVCPIAVDSKCSLVNVQVAHDINNIINISPKSITPLMFISSYRGWSENTIYANNINLVNEEIFGNRGYAWNIDRYKNEYNIENFISVIPNIAVPIVEFDYKKTIYVVFVSASDKSYSDNDSAHRRYFDLNSYVNDFYKTYPYVLSVFLAPYCKYNKNYENFFTISMLSSDDSEITNTTNEQTSIHSFGVLPLGNNIISYDGHEYNNIYRKYEYGSISITTKNGDNYTFINNDSGRLIIGGISSSIPSQLNNSYQYYVLCGSDLFQLKNLHNSSRIYSEYPVTDISYFENWCLSQAAYIGMFFSTSMYSVVNADKNFFTLDTTYLGIIDDSGITHGEYTHGTDNTKQKQFEWDSLRNQSPFDYTKEPDTNKYNTITQLNPNPINTGFGKFTKSYVMQGTEIFLVSQFLYNTIATQIDNEDTNYLTRRFLTNNPIDCITSLMVFPFDLVRIFELSELEQLILGNQPVNYTLSSGSVYNVTGFPLNQATAIIDCGSCTYYRYFKDFRDYEPFSTAEISIPYCGSIPISPAEYMGHTISVKMIVDFSTGGCMALIYRDEMVMDSITGTIGAQVSVSGISQADYQNAIFQANANLKRAQLGTMSQIATAAIGGAASVATGNAGGAVRSIASGIFGMASNSIDLEQAQYELTHVQTPYKTLGTSTPVTSMCNEQAVRLIIKRPKMLSTYNAFEYGRTTGFACLITTTLSNVTGYTKISNIDMSEIEATLSEKQMILQTLQSGVIL